MHFALPQAPTLGLAIFGQTGRVNACLSWRSKRGQHRTGWYGGTSPAGGPRFSTLSVFCTFEKRHWSAAMLNGVGSLFGHTPALWPTGSLACGLKRISKHDPGFISGPEIWPYGRETLLDEATRRAPLAETREASLETGVSGAARAFSRLYKIRAIQTGPTEKRLCSSLFNNPRTTVSARTTARSLTSAHGAGAKVLGQRRHPSERKG